MKLVRPLIVELRITIKGLNGEGAIQPKELPFFSSAISWG